MAASIRGVRCELACCTFMDNDVAVLANRSLMAMTPTQGEGGTGSRTTTSTCASTRRPSRCGTTGPTSSATGAAPGARATSACPARTCGYRRIGPGVERTVVLAPGAIRPVGGASRRRPLPHSGSRLGASRRAALPHGGRKEKGSDRSHPEISKVSRIQMSLVMDWLFLK